jgi:glycosidase
MRKLSVFCVALCSYLFSFGQVSTLPAFPTADREVKIILDSKKESLLGSFSGELWAHTGVGTLEDGNWQYVIGKWGENQVQPKLTYLGDGIYEFVIAPSIPSFYGVPTGKTVQNLSFVFRSSDGSKKTNDIFITIYKDDINVKINNPLNHAIIEEGSTVRISISVNDTLPIDLTINDTLIAQATGTMLDHDYTFNRSGEFAIAAKVTNSEGIQAFDSVFVCVREQQVELSLPEGARKGITYLDNNRVRLVLFAPSKSHVYVLGDFNGWKPSNLYQMHKTGDYFWKEISGLQAGKEYIFQYLIDGSLKIADPYSEKVSDPGWDKSIPSTTYPDLISYPFGKTEGIASVIQTAQQPYQWQVKDFEIPNQKSLVIYEMLIRDFTDSRTFQSVIEKLDYLSDLRVNVLEIMPVNEFEGNSSWGYNPSFYFAPDKFYGPKNDLKRLVDECHKRGIAVVIDMVLNHSYQQSPLLQMYWDTNNNRPALNNPWFNATSPNQVYSWGYDFNHESDYTKEFVDSVNSFWMSEYNIDGFRFDFTKGFTNKPGDGGAFDQTRIDLLKRMTNEIWKRKPGALVILEHLADNSEEKELATHGMLLWGNINHNYGEAAMGYVQGSNSDLSWGIYKQRGWTKPNLITYQESHDEERMAYKCKTWGNAVGNYDTKQTNTALDRLKLNAVFHIPLPGPKMIWQFGELGYDFSINTCDDGVTVSNDCRLDEKPLRWDYKNNEQRLDLFRMYAKLNYLKNTYEEFSSPTNFSYSLSGAQKNFKLTFGNQHVVAVGNFAMEEKTVSLSFPATGTWHDYFGEKSVNVSGETMDVFLLPGEYKLFSTRTFLKPEIETVGSAIKKTVENLLIYPNPVDHFLRVEYKNIVGIEILSITGQKLNSLTLQESSSHIMVDVSGYKRGIYLLRAISTNGDYVSKRFLKE